MLLLSRNYCVKSLHVPSDGGETPGKSLHAIGASGLFLFPTIRDPPCFSCYLLSFFVNYTIILTAGARKNEGLLGKNYP